MTSFSNVILVHGAWADGSCWAKVIPQLAEKGMNATAVQLPLSSFEADVAVVRRAIALADGDLVLVGHSYAGAVIGEAGNDPKVARLFYVDAFAPDAGESAGTLFQQFKSAPLSADLRPDQRGAGAPALVFLHYWGGSSQTWSRVVDALASEFRTVAIDQRGWGQSEARAKGYALSDMASDAKAVIEALDMERYILIGHSMGGKVSQLIASRHPRGLIGLALVAPSPPSPLNLPLDVRQGMVRAYDSRESIIATVAQVLAPGGLDPEDLETVIADSLAGAPAAKEAWPLFASQEDITAAVAGIEIPTLVISGEGDRVDPPDVLRRELLPRIPQARLHALPGVGHLLPYEAPDDVAALIRAFAISTLRPTSASTR